MLPGRMTVDQRRRMNGGFMTGPGNRMLNAVGPKPEPPPSPAPNLREGEPGHECMECGNYEMAERMCRKFNFNPKPYQVCDPFEETEAEAPDDNAPAPMAGGMMGGGMMPGSQEL